MGAAMVMEAFWLRWALTLLAVAAAVVGFVLVDDVFTRLAMVAGVIGVHVVLRDMERHPRKEHPSKESP
jgi:hypothetical protein